MASTVMRWDVLYFALEPEPTLRMPIGATVLHWEINFLETVAPALVLMHSICRYFHGKMFHLKVLALCGHTIVLGT